ncbi:hypothetical protein [Halosolutus gelatinilyticus]|uniref:hypothetical protein n=1 Tax=Halosolutus gelatinilyticus TaxID=2931975 RepID=UPI001FF5FF21|nr:hypothetical protein [Halosolutus gelatinilyticus]
MTRLERRTLLGAIGTGALGATAGCLDFGFLESDEPSRQFDADELGPILVMDVPDVVRPAPVQPSETAVEDARDRLDDLIATVPDPLSVGDVPNEAVRREINRRREAARSGRKSVAESPDRFRTLQRSIRVRAHAGEAAAAFEAVAGERSRATVESERDEIRTRLERRRRAVDHVGDRIQRTLLLEYRLEYELALAEDRLDDDPSNGTTGALAVGEIGGAVERARAAVSFGEVLERRHETRLEDRRSFADRFETALERSLESIDAADVPDESTEPADLVEADVSDTFAERVALEGAIPFVNAAEWTTEAASNGETATALWNACAFERDRRAFETIRDRIEDGAHRSLESVDDVREVRESALESAADVPFEPDDPSLGGDFLAYGYEQLGRIDDRIRETIGDDWQTGLSSEYTDYVVIGAQLGALPEAVAVLEDRLGE